MNLSTHKFSPFWESDSPCWCGRAPEHRLHKGSVPFIDSPEGKLFKTYMELNTKEARKEWLRVKRWNNFISFFVRGSNK